MALELLHSSEYEVSCREKPQSVEAPKCRIHGGVKMKSRGPSDLEL
jgi:hypothetical protein